MLKPRGTHGVDWVCTTQGTGHDDFPYIDLRASLRPRRRDGAVSVTDSARTCPNPTSAGASCSWQPVPQHAEVGLV